MAEQTPISELDFSTIKGNLKEFLQGQSQFKDYDFAGSNLNVLLDVLSYNTYYNNFYTNMTFSEMFLDSAQLRESVISHAKELNYLPASCRSSQASVQVDLKNVTGDPGFVTIPKHTKFTGKAGGKSYTFTTDQSYTIIPSEGAYCLSNVFVYEGKILTESFKKTGRADQRFILSNENLDTNSIKISVRDSSESGAATTEYTVRENLFGVSANDNVFYIQAVNKNQYEIIFGRNVFGSMPKTNNIIDVTYRVGSKDAPNGISTFTSSQIGGFNTKITTVSKAEGGADRESEESIKFFAPRSIQMQDRAITESDYEILLKNRFSEIQAVSVYGGEETTPPQFGRVIVSVDVKNAEGVSENTRNRFKNFLKERCPLSVEPVVVSPEFMYLDVTSTVYFNTKTTDKADADIKQVVKDAITKYSTDNLSDFRKTFRYSKFLSAIDNGDENIISNNTEVRAVIEIDPLLNTRTSYDLKFKNELDIDHPLTTGEDILDHVPAIKSSTFTFNGARGFIQDDGQGVLNIIKTSTTSFVYLKRNVGTVDYSTGRVIIRNLNVDAYTGTGIKILAKTKSPDVTSPKERIITIRDSDIAISVMGVRE